MIFIETELKGAFVINPERLEDERGFFARTWCRREFKDYGIDTEFVQCNISFNKKKGTLRGMHYQVPPYMEAKLVRCTMGAMLDVMIDIRPQSSTYKHWISVELTHKNRKMLYIPKGFAHGFLTLMDDSEVFYQMSEFYKPEYARGIRWNDPVFNIDWPDEIVVMSDRDRNYPNFIS